MRPIVTKERLKGYIDLVNKAGTEDFDELLHDLLVKVYPSKEAQDS